MHAARAGPLGHVVHAFHVVAERPVRRRVGAAHEACVVRVALEQPEAVRVERVAQTRDRVGVHHDLRWSPLGYTTLTR